MWLVEAPTIRMCHYELGNFLRNSVLAIEVMRLGSDAVDRRKQFSITGYRGVVIVAVQGLPVATPDAVKRAVKAAHEQHRPHLG